MKQSNIGNNKGFTLIEVIVTIMIAAVLGTTLFTYTQQLSFSALPLTRVGKALSLQKTMENIYTDHKLNFPFSLTGLQAKIGLSGAQNNDYGQYEVVDNKFIKFVGNTETVIVNGVDPQNILKITLKNDLGEQITGILVAK